MQAPRPFVEGIREGLEDGNLAALLSWYLEHLPESQVRADVQSRLSRILGTAPDSILPYHVATRRSQLSVMQIAGDNDNYQRAKREVLECIEQLRPEIERHIKPSLYWQRCKPRLLKQVQASTRNPERRPRFNPTGNRPRTCDLCESLYKFCFWSLCL